MAQLADNIQRLIGTGVTLQNLKNQTAGVAIRKQNADTIAARNPAILQNANTSRFKSLLDAGLAEQAADFLDNLPANKAKQTKTTIDLPKSVMTVKGPRGASKSFLLDKRTGALTPLPDATFEGETGPKITNDVAEFLLQRQELLKQPGVTEDSREVQEIDEVLKGMREQNPESFRNRVFEDFVQKAGGDVDKAREKMIAFEGRLTGQRASDRTTETELAKQKLRPLVEERLAGEATAQVQGRNRVTLAKQKTDTRRIVDMINGIQEELNTNPAIVALPGALSKTITSFADQAANLAELLVPGKHFTILNNVKRYGQIFRETGIGKAKLDAKFLGIALAVASAEGFRGRAVTELKVRANLKRLGESLGSAEAMFKVLEEFKQELAQGYQSSIEAFNNLEGLDQPILGPEDTKEFLPTATPTQPVEPSTGPQQEERPTTAEEEARRFLEGGS